LRKIPYKYAVALTAALGLFMAVLDNTIVNVALYAMLESFSKKDPGVNVNTIQWVVTAYFITQAAVIPVAGYLSTKFGVKRMFMLALSIFTLGSLLCGLSPELDSLFGGGGVTLLVVFRVFQGLGGGMLFPLATSISFNVFPPAERAASSAVIAVPVLLAPTLGPTVGGLLVDSNFAWPSIFFINIPVGLLAFFLIGRLLKPDTGRASNVGVAPAKSAGFDYVGLVLSVVGTIMVVYAFTIISQTNPDTISLRNPRGDIYGWGYWLVWALLGSGLVVLALFSFYEIKIAKDPVLDLRLFKSNIFLVSTLMTWIVRAVIFGSFIIIPIFLEQFKGESAVITGLALMPQGIGAGIGIISGSRLYDRIGPRMLVILGMLMLTLSSIILMGVTKDSDGWSFAIVLLIRGIGFGWSNLPLQTSALSAITGRALPKASSLYNATAQIFSSIGIAVITTLFVEGLSSRTNDLVNSARASNLPIPNPTSTAFRDQFLTTAAAGSVSNVFMLVGIGTALAIIIALFLPSKSIKQLQKAKSEENSNTVAPIME
jgi:EmrB/QacA subfamily drug resistance transporter